MQGRLNSGPGQEAGDELVGELSEAEMDLLLKSGKAGGKGRESDNGQRKDSHKVGALRDLHSREAQAGGEGTGIHPLEPGNRASRQCGDPRHGGQDSASG